MRRFLKLPFNASEIQLGISPENELTVRIFMPVRFHRYQIHRIGLSP